VKVAVIVPRPKQQDLSIWRSARPATQLSIELFSPSYADDTPHARKIRTVGLKGEHAVWTFYPTAGRTFREFDVLHIQSEPWALSVVWAVAVGLPVVAHVADNIYWHGSQFEIRARRAALRYVLPRLAGLASWNPTGLRLAHQAGLPRTTPTLIAPADVTSLRDSNLVLERVRQDGRRHVVFVGRLAPEKGPDVLLEACSLSKSRQDIVLTMLGDGPLRQTLVRRAQELDVELRCPGTLSRDQVSRVLATQDVAVVPSRALASVAEQFSRFAVEAMAAGLPTIVAAVGDVPWVVGNAGLVVPPESPTSLAEALDSLLHDDDERTRRSKLSLSRAREFSPAAVADKLDMFWQEVAAWSRR